MNEGSEKQSLKHNGKGQQGQDQRNLLLELQTKTTRMS